MKQNSLSYSVILDKSSLENHMIMLGSNHKLMQKSDKDKYPIPKLKSDYEYISKIYVMLNQIIKDKILIHPAGEWILDNEYVIEEVVKNIEKELSLGKYREFLGLKNEEYLGHARIEVLANEIVNVTDANINKKMLEEVLLAYQKSSTLNMDEIWALKMFLEIAIIERIKKICETIEVYEHQIEKAEKLISNIMEKKESTKLVKSFDEIQKKILKKEDSYAYVKHISYLLKAYGRKGIKYLNVLEELTKKMGTSIFEISKKENYNIASKKVSMKNCILSLKNIQRINFYEIFENINGVEEILKKDPLDIYSNMDYQTKNEYRNEIKRISKETKLSEIYIAETALSLAKEANNLIQSKEIVSIKDKKRCHIGYYIISKGREKLKEEIGEKEKTKIETKEKRLNKYILKIYLTSFIFSILTYIYFMAFNVGFVLSLILAISMYIPYTQIVNEFVNLRITKKIKPKVIPKLDFSKGVTPSEKTMVVFPSVISSIKVLKQMIRKMEIAYLSNKSPNIYFTLLGDPKESDTLETSLDKKIEKIAKEEIEKLNEKYKENKIPIFNVIYRKREYNKKEEKYLGWERKRGMLNELNEFLLSHKNPSFLVNTININNIKDIKYIVTVDSDTKFNINSIKEMIGAMAHILNKPELDEEKNIVIEGYGIMAPKVNIGLDDANKNLFTILTSNSIGLDMYTSSSSNIYEDYFDEGIYSGKGIYDLNVFSKVLNGRFEENKILSHDLLEGSYLRCSLLTDVTLLDGTPKTYISYTKRLNRWVRGDIQILPFLKGKVKNEKKEIKNNPLSRLSKLKIFDNLRRAIFVPFVLLSLILLLIAKNTSNANIIYFLMINVLALCISNVLDIIFNTQNLSKNFSKNLQGIKIKLIYSVMQIFLLPTNTKIYLEAIIKSIYRMNISKKHLLEWTAQDEVEKDKNKDSYYIYMYPNLLFGIFLSIYSIYNSFKIFTLIIAIGYLIMPYIMKKICKESKNKNIYETLNKEEREYVLDLAKKTWSFFEENLNEENNFLPPDNIQEGRKEKVAKRTSPTNMGLSLLSIVSAFDLKYISLEKALDLIYRELLSISKLERYEGHLYNWYNIETLNPLYPRYVSSVDNGNYIGYLYTLKQFIIRVITLEKEDSNNSILAKKILEIINKEIQLFDFSKLYDNEKELFSIGYNVEEGAITKAYYDMLASEARQTSFVAIAKGDAPYKHWNRLSRSFTSLKNYEGLISWARYKF